MRFITVAAFCTLAFQALSLAEEEQVHNDILEFEDEAHDKKVNTKITKSKKQKSSKASKVGNKKNKGSTKKASKKSVQTPCDLPILLAI